jgi:hypothetical protein
MGVGCGLGKKTFAMRKIIVLVILVAGGWLLSSFLVSALPGIGLSSLEDSSAAERKKIITAILDSLKDKAVLPADSVFDNLQLFGPSYRLKVRHLLAVMDYWGESLGVSCKYCHTVGKWASDDLPAKRIAREMYNMRLLINDQVLANMKDLQVKLPAVNCGTCHGGKKKPPSD